MRISPAMAPGFALVPAAGALAAGPSPHATTATASSTAIVSAHVDSRPVPHAAFGLLLVGWPENSTQAERHVDLPHLESFAPMAPTRGDAPAVLGGTYQPQTVPPSVC
jgi:hypothetical protein